MEIHFCEACQTRLSDADIATGEAVRDADSVFCKPCALKLGIYQRAREALELEEAPPRRTRSRRRQAPPPAASGSQARIYAACGVIVCVIVVLGVVIARRGGEGPAGRPVPRRDLSPPPPAVARPTREEIRAPAKPEPPPPVRPVAPERAPVAPPRPRVSEKPPAPPSPPPPAEGEISIFNGRDLTGWRQAGGTVSVEDGAIVAAKDADVFYAADWAEFVLSCEISGGGQGGDLALGLGLGHSSMGRGQWRVSVSFHGDGDAHVRAPSNVVWRSGGGKFPLDRWTPVKLELTRTALRVYRGEELLGSVGLNTVAVRKGGIYFFANAGHTARMRNVRVRVLSR